MTLGSTLTVGVLIGVLVAASEHRHPERQHTSTVDAVFALIAGVLTLAAIIGFVYWLARRGKGMFSAALILGLPLRDRRKVSKAVRRGLPPSEPMLRVVGLRTAERMLRYRKPVFVLYGLLALSQLLNAVVPGRPRALIVLSAIGLVLFLAALAYQWAVVVGARRYIEQVQRKGD